MAQIQQPFNFWLYQADFEKDTKLKAKDNVQAYMTYFIIRQNDGMRASLALVGNHIASVIRENKV